MAAPAGYRTWSTADLVSASDFSTYVQDQICGVYTSTSNRSSELSSPAEGQISYLTDSNVFSIYNGSAWVDVLDVDTISVTSGNYAMTGTLTLNAGSDTFSLPTTRGSNTNVLQSDGDGTTSWVAATTGDITGLTAGTNIDISSATGPVPTVTLAIDAAVVFGSDGSGVDVTMHSATAGDALVWSAASESLTITGTDGQTALDVPDGNVTITDDLTVSGTTFTYLNVLTDSTTTRTPALTDAGAYILTTHGTGITVTLPQNSAVAFPVGTTIYFERNGAGTLTFAAGTGATVTSKDSTLTCGNRYTTVAAVKIGTNAWSLIGNLG